MRAPQNALGLPTAASPRKDSRSSEGGAAPGPRPSAWSRAPGGDLGPGPGLVGKLRTRKIERRGPMAQMGFLGDLPSMVWLSSSKPVAPSPARAPTRCQPLPAMLSPWPLLNLHCCLPRRPHSVQVSRGGMGTHSKAAFTQGRLHMAHPPKLPGRPLPLRPLGWEPPPLGWACPHQQASPSPPGSTRSGTHVLPRLRAPRVQPGVAVNPVPVLAAPRPRNWVEQGG